MKNLLQGNDVFWKDEIISVTRKYITIGFSTKVTTIWVFYKRKKREDAHKVFPEKKEKPKVYSRKHVRTADKRIVFSERYTTSKIYALYTLEESFNLTIPNYQVNNLPEIPNETLARNLTNRWKKKYSDKKL